MSGFVERVWAIAHNSFREAVRNRVLYTLFFFALILIASGVLLSTLSYVERERIMQDIGMGAIRIFSILIAIFVGIGLIHKEVERRTIFTILSKPIARAEFLIGKYVGLVTTLALLIVVMALSFSLVSLLSGAPLTTTHAAAFLLIGGEVAIVAAIACLFSSFTTPMLASFFSGGLVVIGHLSRDLRALGAAGDGSVVRGATEALYMLAPDLEAFDLSVHATHGLAIATSDIAVPLVYATGYVTLLLTVAIVAFERRDFR